MLSQVLGVGGEIIEMLCNCQDAEKITLVHLPPTISSSPVGHFKNEKLLTLRALAIWPAFEQGYAGIKEKPGFC